jgi:hypothetical protein
VLAAEGQSGCEGSADYTCQWDEGGDEPARDFFLARRWHVSHWRVTDRVMLFRRCCRSPQLGNMRCVCLEKSRANEQARTDHVATNPGRARCYHSLSLPQACLIVADEAMVERSRVCYTDDFSGSKSKCNAANQGGGDKVCVWVDLAFSSCLTWNKCRNRLVHVCFSLLFHAALLSYCRTCSTVVFAMLALLA